jgi:hypothetical protein
VILGRSGLCLGGFQFRGFEFGGFLLARLDREVVADRAAGYGAEDRVMMRKMPRHGADHRAFQAPGFCGNGGTRKHESCKHSGNLAPHLVLRWSRNAS